MAISLDGTDDALTTTTNVFRHPDFSSTSYTFTASCWVKLGKSQNATIWSQSRADGSGAVGQGRLVLEQVASYRVFRLRFQNASSTSSTSTPAWTTDYDTWYHLVATMGYTAAQGRHLYLNGNSTPIISKDDSTVPAGSNRISLHEDDDLDFSIGAGFATSSPWAQTSFFEGEVAEFAAWKTILSAGDISSLYSGASPLFIQPDQLLSYYPLGGPLVASSTGTTDAFKDVVGGNNLTAVSAPAFAETPPYFGTENLSSSMFYPNTYMANDTIPFTQAAEEEEEEAPSEAALTGSDVIHEIITASDRKQGGICVNSGGVTFSKRGNDIQIPAQNQITELDTKYVKENRQDHRDEISTDTNNSDGWFGV
jgi:hypothetical protein